MFIVIDVNFCAVWESWFSKGLVITLPAGMLMEITCFKKRTAVIDLQITGPYTILKNQWWFRCINKKALYALFPSCYSEP